MWLCRDGKGKASSGMVLPFDPMTMTFKDLHYYVPIPKVTMPACDLCYPNMTYSLLIVYRLQCIEYIHA